MALREILATFKVNFDSKALKAGSAAVDRVKRSLTGMTTQTGAAAAGANRTGAAVGTIGLRAQQSAAGVAALKAQLAGMTSGIGKLQAAGALLAGAFAVGIVKNFFNEILQGADAVGKTSTALGLATDKVQAWEAFAQQAGGSAEDFKNSYKRMSKAAFDATRSAMSPAAEGFRTLGIEVKRADGSLRDTEDLLIEAGGALGTMTDRTKALAIAQDLMGRGALRLLPGFTGGADAAREQIAALKELAVVYDEQMVRESEKLNDEMLVTGLQFKKISVALVRAFIPIMRAASAILTPLMNGFAKLIKNTNFLQIALSLLAGKGLAMLITKVGAVVKAFGGWRAVIARLLPFIVKFLLPFAILDDIITTLQGGDSIIRRILNKLFGADKAGAIIEGINDVIDGTIGGVKSLFTWIANGFSDPDGKILSGFLQTTEKLAGALDAFFAWGLEQFNTFATWIGGILVEGWDLAMKDLGAAWNSLWSDITEAFTSVVAGIVGIWDTAIASMKAGVSGLIDGAVGILNKLPGVNIDATANTPAVNNVGSSTRNITINDNTRVASTINAPTAQAAVQAGVSQANAFNLPKRRLATLNAVRQ